MRKVKTKSVYVTVLLILIIIGVVLISGCVKKEKTPIEPLTLVPKDSPLLPSRGFFMGVLPSPAQGQSFDDAYSQAAQHSEFVPVWGRPTPFYNLASDLKGDWGEVFVDQLIRGKGMFPIIHLSFIGGGLTLVTPPGMENATLSNPAWREEYKKAALNVVRAARPRYLSLLVMK